MEQIEMIVNRLPAPTWNRLGMNQSGVKVTNAANVCEPKVALQGNVCLNKSTGHSGCASCCASSGCCHVHRDDDLADLPTGMGKDLDKLGDGGALHLVADAGKSLAAVTLRYDDDKHCYNKIQVEAKPGSQLTLLMTYISTAVAGGTAAVQTKLNVARGAKVKLVQVQLLGRGFDQLNDDGCQLADDAGFELVQLQLGACRVFNGARAELQGESSSFDAAIGYYGRHGQQLDMNFIANHYGKSTTCNMTADGVLRDGARKIYRGTIDFKNGSAGAVGDEKETVLMLTDDVVNQSIPLILCAEEDVQGNHGASIGKLDEELLFYLMSRGFSEHEAIDMMAKAKIEALCRKIDDEDTVQLVERYLEGVIADGE